jgi:alpha-mannosidase
VEDVVLWRDLPRIDFVTRIHWEERQVLLKVAFPVEVLAPRATYEVQFGAVERPTHVNTPWDQEKFEVPAQRWADLSEAYYGVSLLNDCKYGYDVRGSTLRLTLLRGAEWPDPGADLGEHELAFCLYPHQGDWRVARTVQQAAELNVPLVRAAGTPARSSAASESFFSIEGPAVIETLKPAEDGDGYIVRLHEPCGGRGAVTVRSSRELRGAELVNLVEEPAQAGDGSPEVALGAAGHEISFRIRPFGIVTLRLRTAG